MLAGLHAHMMPPSSKAYTEVVLLGHTKRAEFATLDGCIRVYMSIKSVAEVIVDISMTARRL
jgi:hypothetical protein